jgi:hypothetical protein
MKAKRELNWQGRQLPLPHHSLFFVARTKSELKQKHIKVKN